MREEYVEFKVVRDGATLSIKIDRTDLTTVKMGEHFAEFLLAMGYQPTNVADLLNCEVLL